jgi:hypothetical protein
MTNLLNFGRDMQGYNAYAPQDAPFKKSATLTVGSAASFTIPSSYPVWVVAFSPQPGANVWVDMSGATAAVPVGATFATTTSTLNPGQRTVVGGTSISCITDNTTADIGVEAWPVGLP